MVPAPLLRRLGEHGRQGAPDPEVAVTDHQLWGRQPAALEVAQDRRPALGRFPIATLDGQDHLLRVAQCRQDHEDRGLVLLEAASRTRHPPRDRRRRAPRPTGVFHRSYSACQPAFSRAIDGADSGRPLAEQAALWQRLLAAPGAASVRVWQLLPIGLTPKHTTGRRPAGPCRAAEPTRGIVRSQPDRHMAAYVTATGPADETPVAGGCSCCLRSGGGICPTRRRRRASWRTGRRGTEG
jgi:hypothetical protein